jgi:hypothetical protein
MMRTAQRFRGFSEAAERVREGELTDNSDRL